MPTKQRATPTKANGSAGTETARSRSGKKNASPKMQPGPRSGKKSAPPPITHSSRETVTPGIGSAKKGKGDFLGKGGVLTLGKAASGRRNSRGSEGGGTPRRTVSGGKGGGTPKGQAGAAAAKTSGPKKTSRTTGDESSSGDPDDEDDDDGSENADMDGMEESSDDGDDVVKGAKAAARSNKAALKGRKQDEDEDEDEDEDDAEESEQELQSFMEAFPGMSSEEEEEGGGVLGGARLDDDDDSAHESGSEEDDEDEDGLMEVNRAVEDNCVADAKFFAPVHIFLGSSIDL